MIDRQAVFSKVAAHLLKQNGRSLLPHTQVCAYRDKNGRSCAIGCLIIDEAYDESLEGWSVNSDRVNSALIKSGIDLRPWTVISANYDADVAFLVSLQLIHDEIVPFDWHDGLSKFAARHQLSMP